MNENPSRGDVLILNKKTDGHKPGTRVVFSHILRNPTYFVVNPEGEPDMQSSFVVLPEEVDPPKETK
jgi:hypothetical protein